MYFSLLQTNVRCFPAPLEWCPHGYLLLLCLPPLLPSPSPAKHPAGEQANTGKLLHDVSPQPQKQKLLLLNLLKKKDWIFMNAIGGKALFQDLSKVRTNHTDRQQRVTVHKGQAKARIHKGKCFINPSQGYLLGLKANASSKTIQCICLQPSSLPSYSSQPGTLCWGLSQGCL